MAAVDATCTLSGVTTIDIDRGMDKEFYKIATATITVVSADDTDTYPTGGIPLPSGWQATLGMSRYLALAIIGPLTLTYEAGAVGYVAKIDQPNEKVVLYGGASTAAEDVPLEQLEDDTAILEGSYTAQLIAVGL